ncbi:hypothetical protein ACIQZI_04055 [Peribacillus sp. NPDC096379]|uniref:hypothetical protein n=1 Tax=Peribacillus sp. NPDC096379 TaxID=3364393 RepID=UPI0037F80A13
MCQICNGTHVVSAISVSSIIISCCPICGPESEEVQNARFADMLSEIAQIKRLRKKDA